MKLIDIINEEDALGFKTTKTSVDPETGQVTWDVEYTPDFQKVFKEVSDLLETAKDISLNTDDVFFRDFYNDIRKLRNQLRTSLRNNHPDVYQQIKGVSEMMTTGTGASFTPGKGAQYATPKAFNPNKKAKGTATNYYYKLGYKPVDVKKLRKQAKGIETKDLWK